MQYEIQFARIANSGKLPDRFLTCQHHISQDLSKSSMGHIFALIEILSPWFPTGQMGQTIINSFTKSYYQGGSTSNLVNFEESLKKVNETMAQATQNGETDWIGKLNSSLAVIVDNSLHITTTGQIEAYLFRDGKLNHLTEGAANGIETHPLKTFSNIISGDLKNHDKILLTNKELFNHLSLESVRQVITLNSPGAAALNITRLLRKSRAKNVNLVIVSLITKEELSSQAINEDLESVYYLDKSPESVSQKFKAFSQTIILPIVKIMAHKTKENVGSYLNQIKSKTELSKKGNQLPSSANGDAPKQKEDRFHKEFLSEDSRDDSLLRDEEIRYSPDLYVHYYKEKKAQKENKTAKFLGWAVSKCQAILYWFRATYQDKKRRKILYIMAAGLIVIILALFIFNRSSQSKTGNLEAQKILDEAIALQKQGETQLSSGNQEEGKKTLVIAIGKAKTIRDNMFVSKDANKIISESNAEIDKLISATRFSQLNPTATFPEKPKAIFIVSGDAFAFSDSNVYQVSLAGGDPKKIASFPTSKGSFMSGTKAGSLIYAYTSDQNMYEFDPSTKKLTPLQIEDSGKWETANSIASYAGNIYLLDGVMGKIYRHSSSRSSFEAGDSYLPDSVNVKDSVSIAIDGSVYVLGNNGEVSKFQMSRRKEFSLKNVPTPYDKIEGPRKILTESDTSNLYILDSSQKRLLQFDKDGYFVHQYMLPDDFDNITDFTVSEKSRKAWVTSKNSFYEINI